MTNIIKKLIKEKFNLFNVDLLKCPVDKNGVNMKVIEYIYLN